MGKKSRRARGGGRRGTPTSTNSKVVSLTRHLLDDDEKIKKKYADGTLTGSFVGSFELTGDLGGDVALDLEISANIEEIPDQAGKTRRVAGSTRVTGTAESAWGTFDVDVTR